MSRTNLRRAGLLDITGDARAVELILNTRAIIVCAERFGDPKTVDGEQGDERVITARRQSGGNEERANPVAGAVETRADVVVEGERVPRETAIPDAPGVSLPQSIAAAERGQAHDDHASSLE